MFVCHFDGMWNFEIKTKRWTLGGLVGIYIFAFFVFWQIPDNKLHLNFLNIGQGDSILIKSPENHYVLIDGGPKNKVIEELGEVLPFFVKKIDLMILSHPHADHIDGLVEVLKRYKVENILFSGVDFKSPAYDEFLTEILNQQINVFIADKETDFRLGDVVLDTIYPLKQIAGESFKNLNNSSVAVKLLYGDLAVFLPGDLEKEAEKELVDSGIDLHADILKAGHHGSKSSSTIEFLREVKPKIVVIQSGENNKFGHPHKESLENFEAIGVQRVYRNDLEERIEFIF